MWVGRSAFYIASSANLCGRTCQALINRTFNRALLVPIAVAVTLAGFASPAFAAPPTADIAFSPTTIPLNGTTTLTITVNNPNNFRSNQAQYTQTLPAGLTVASLVGNGCVPSNTTATGGSTISVLGFPLGPGATCIIRVSVTGATAAVGGW
jgi:hypothetical protein